MKKIIPAIVAIALILVVLGVSFGLKVVERFSYSKEEQNCRHVNFLHDGLFVEVFRTHMNIPNSIEPKRIPFMRILFYNYF